MNDFESITDPIDIPITEDPEDRDYIGVPPPEPKWYEIINADIEWKIYLEEVMANVAIILG